MTKAAYVIMEAERTGDGFIPCIVKEGETGYYRTDWNWGNDLETAQEIANKKNTALGLDQAEVNRLILQSMRRV